MALLAQLPHHAPVLDFGDSREVLHLFQCTTVGCPTFDYEDGCNAAFFLRRMALGEGLTPTPRTVSTPVNPSMRVEMRIEGLIEGITPAPRTVAEDPSMHGELWITGWKEYEDAIPQNLSPAYVDYDAFYALPKKFQFPHDFDSGLSTKAGGVPYWTGNGPGGLPKIPVRPFEYLMQIDTFLSIQGSLPDPSAIGCDVWREANGEVELHSVPGAAKRENAPWSARSSSPMDDEYSVEFANFGSGTAYVFINRETIPPRAILFWNR
jgi:hypothetical protein